MAIWQYSFFSNGEYCRRRGAGSPQEPPWEPQPCPGTSAAGQPPESHHAVHVMGEIREGQECGEEVPGGGERLQPGRPHHQPPYSPNGPGKGWVCCIPMPRLPRGAAGVRGQALAGAAQGQDTVLAWGVPESPAAVVGGSDHGPSILSTAPRGMPFLPWCPVRRPRPSGPLGPPERAASPGASVCAAHPEFRVQGDGTGEVVQQAEFSYWAFCLVPSAAARRQQVPAQDA